MSIEGGTISISAGPTVVAGPKTGPSLGSSSGLGRFGAEVRVPFSAPSVGGQKGSFLENTVSYTPGINTLETASEMIVQTPIRQSKAGLNLLDVFAEVDAILSPAKSELSTKDAVSEAEAILSEARPKITEPNDVIETAKVQANPEEIKGVKKESTFKAQALLILVAARVFLPLPIEALPPPQRVEQDRIIQVMESPKVHTVPFKQHGAAVLHTQTQSHPVEQASEEVLEPEEHELPEQERKKGRPQQQVQNQELTLSHKVDKGIVEKRIKAIKQVAEELEKEGKKGPIEGWKLVKKLLSLNFREFRGEELEKADPLGVLPDGTWEANLENLQHKVFASKAELEVQAPEIVAKDNPVAKGKGEGVNDKNMQLTFKHDKTKIHPVHQVIIRRILKKVKQPGLVLPLAPQGREEREGKITDHPELAQALQAA